MSGRGKKACHLVLYQQIYASIDSVLYAAQSMQATFFPFSCSFHRFRVL